MLHSSAELLEGHSMYVPHIAQGGMASMSLKKAAFARTAAAAAQRYVAIF